MNTEIRIGITFSTLRPDTVTHTVTHTFAPSHCGYFTVILVDAGDAACGLSTLLCGKERTIREDPTTSESHTSTNYWIPGMRASKRVHMHSYELVMNILHAVICHFHTELPLHLPREPLVYPLVHLHSPHIHPS